MTTFNFTITESDIVNISIYDLQGKKIKTVINEHLNKGLHSFKLNSEDLMSGTYYYRMRVGYYSDITKKMIVIK